jgi:hypothetical protein
MNKLSTTLTVFLDTLESCDLSMLNSIMESDKKEIYLSLNESNTYDIYLTDDYATLSDSIRRYANLNWVRDLSKELKDKIREIIKSKSQQNM